MDTKAYSDPNLESHRDNRLKRPAQCDRSNQQKRQRRSPTSGEPDPTFTSGSDDGDDGEDKHDDTDDEQEDEDEDKEDEDKDKEKEDGSVQDDQSDRGERRFTAGIQISSHEQPPHCEPSGNQAERDCSEGASGHSGPDNALNGSAASSRSGTAVLKSFMLESQVTYQSPYPPLAQSGSGAPPVRESHATGHTLPHPRSKSVEQNIQETLPITQAQVALSSDRNEAGD